MILFPVSSCFNDSLNSPPIFLFLAFTPSILIDWFGNLKKAYNQLYNILRLL